MTTRNCQNCNVSYGPDDMFCENCGYDFITGSLPADESGPTASGPPPDTSTPADGAEGAPPAVAPSVLAEDGASEGSSSGTSESGGAVAADVARLTMVISVDREYFDEVVNDGEIAFPDPVPTDQELHLAGDELHIGRTSESRAIHPDIDVADLTGDQAVSSRHAVLRVSTTGGYTIVDVGSTNGTFIGSVDSEAIVQGVPATVGPGEPIYVGAWTRLTISA